jgi:DNA-directed RNA polymerase subunit alpha
MQMFVEVGRGYRLADWPSNTKFHEDGRIFIDSLFSPILKVGYNVEKTRVGQSIDYDKLVLNVQTNGAVDPEESIEYAVSVLRTNCKFLLKGKSDLKFNTGEHVFKDAASPVASECEIEPSLGVPVDLFTKPIETLELSVRAQNCLDSAEIRTVLDLVNLSDEEALKIKNFGRKTLKEVKEVLIGLGLRLGMNIKTHDLKKARKENSPLNISKFG